MQINNRQRKLIQLLLNRSAPLHGTELVQSLGFTTRTLRQDIALINSAFDSVHAHIKSNPSKGYWMEEADKAVFASLIYQEKLDVIPANQNQREIAVCFYLLDHDEEYTSMGQLADLIYVSKTTISNTIKHIGEIMQASKGLQLMVSPQKGLQILGTEYAKRTLYSSIMLLFYELEKTYIHRYIQATYDKFHISETLYEILMAHTIHHNRMLTNKSLMITANEVLISIYRVHIMHREMDFMEHVEEASLPFEQIEKQLNLTFSKTDQAYLHHMAKKKRTYGTNKDQDRIEELPSSIIQEYYDEVLAKFQISLHEQKKLTEHIAAMVYYHQTNMYSDDHDLYSMRLCHPFAYEIAILMDPILRRYLKKAMTENEVNSLTARISVILNRQIRKLNVILLTNQSTSLCELLKVELELYFGQILNIVGIYPFYSLSSIPTFEQIDVLLATSREHLDISTDVIYINPVLNMEDLQTLNAYINAHKPSYCGVA